MKKIFLDKLILPGSGTSAETSVTDENIDPGKDLLEKALKSIFK